MQYLPIFIDIKDRQCLLVGGGDVAARKATLLLNAGAKVEVLAPVLGAALSREHQNGRITYTNRGYESSDLTDCCLAISATDDRELNAKVATDAKALGIPVNVVDSPELCSFIIPSIVDRSPVMVAVSSSGASPVLARLLRARLETLIPASYGQLATLVQGFRDRVKARFSTSNKRRLFWED
ncbi:MAG: siroheme synthase, partial [Gammaproteobacteria bacterium]|nr:siroheme synthase [Gammaproteobacteria bacterium]